MNRQQIASALRAARQEARWGRRDRVTRYAFHLAALGHERAATRLVASATSGKHSTSEENAR